MSAGSRDPIAEPRVWTLFHGSYMNRRVLAEVDLVPDRFEVARLSGFDIRIAPRANLVPSDQHCVYGLLAQATHQELVRLYAHAQDVLGERYWPHPVVIEAPDGRWRPALCYTAPDMEPRRPDRDYVERILAPAREYGFPGWYIARLESFRP